MVMWRMPQSFNEIILTADERAALEALARTAAVAPTSRAGRVSSCVWPRAPPTAT